MFNGLTSNLGDLVHLSDACSRSISPENFTGEKGKGGVSYEDRNAFCFETQMYPDSVNHPQFPSPVVKAGTAHVTRTSYRFYIGK